MTRSRVLPRVVLGALLLTALAPNQTRAESRSGSQGPTNEVGPTTPYPILFVTQVPLPTDFATINSTFANHLAAVDVSTRGGDLWIRYPDGTLKNLTAAAGFGNEGFQGASSIAVRDPAVHWDGTRALFAMAIGSVEIQYQVRTWYWQLYEITGLGLADTPVISRVRYQPSEYNNVMPAYGDDGRILFVSDRPHEGAAHLYPLLDEYERTPTNSGLWSLDPHTSDLQHLDHAPSGSFDPIIDSFGRVVFTRWDHLERDQLADADAGPVSSCYGGTTYGSITFSDESPAATSSFDLTEFFPEPRSCRNDLLAGTNLDGHGFNHFFPWMMRQSGTDLETLNHIGRHELHGYLARTFNNDPNVVEFYAQYPRTNPNPIASMFQIAESPAFPGLYLGTHAPEFGTHASGQIIQLASGPSVNPDDIVVTYVTHPSTASPSDNPPPEHSGLYRDPLRLSDAAMVVSHTHETRSDANSGTTQAPLSRYDYRLKTLAAGPGGYWVPGPQLTGGIVKSVSWWSPDVLVSYSGPLWELNAVEVRPRPRVGPSSPSLPPQEAQAFVAAGVDVAAFRSYLFENDLALIVARDVTTRDDLDRQQPFNLRVPGGTQTIAAPGTVYDAAHIQFFQADHLRGEQSQPGRRVLARPMHDPSAMACNPSSPSGPSGSNDIAADGSMAALVPARRALSWQLTDTAHTGVVRERFWLTFQPGEIRVCASCHGVNRNDQVGQATPGNQPQALVDLLQSWTTCAPPHATVGDLNTDHRADIIWERSTGEHAAWIMNGTTLVSGASLPPVGDTNWKLVGSGDFNGDGKEDLVLRNQPIGLNAVWLMNGTTLIGGVYLVPAPPEWALVATGDLNRDGQDDLIWRSTAGDNAVWLMAGTTIQSAVVLMSLTDTNWHLAGTGDFTGDGERDILWRNVASGDNAIWVMNGTATVTGAYLPGVTDTNWSIGAIADYNADGKVDILWRNGVSGENAAWLMNTHQIVSGVYLMTVPDLNWRMVGPR